MHYTVKQLAKIAGVSVRALHYYDEIGLLKPSFIKENGYRCYEEKELLKLQQILFFRELDFPLEKIKDIMKSTDYDALSALSDQQKLLEIKKQRIEKLLRTIRKTIVSLKGGEHMVTDDTFSAFTDPTYQKYKDEVEKKWGDTKAYKQSRERFGKLSKADLERIKAESEDIAQMIAGLMTKGFAFDNNDVQEQINRFYRHLHHFYDPSYELFKGLGQIYVDDARFTQYYEKRAKGLAVFMRDAMVFYADEHLKNKKSSHLLLNS